MKKILTIVGALLVLLLGAGGVYAVMNNNTNKQYDEAITKAEKQVKEHKWTDAQNAYKDAAKIKKTDMTTAANEQLTAIMNAETVAGNDQQGAIDILNKSMKQEVTVPVIMDEMNKMKADLQKQLDADKKQADKDGSRSELKKDDETLEAKPEEEKATSEKPETEAPKQEGNTKREQNIAEGNMTVAQARARLAEQGKNIDYVPDPEVQQLIQTVKSRNGASSLSDVATEMRW